MKRKPGFRASNWIEAGRIFECSTMLDCQRGNLSGQQLRRGQLSPPPPPPPGKEMGGAEQQDVEHVLQFTFRLMGAGADWRRLSNIWSLLIQWGVVWKSLECVYITGEETDTAEFSCDPQRMWTITRCVSEVLWLHIWWCSWNSVCFGLGCACGRENWA